MIIGMIYLALGRTSGGIGIEHGIYVGSRSSNALPLSISIGTDTCSWVMSHLTARDCRADAGAGPGDQRAPAR
jgi:hypothetical protein